MSNTKYLVGNSLNIKEIFTTNELPQPQLVISSPPYFDVLNYEDNDSQIGHGSLNYETYIEEVTKVYNDCYDLCSADASLWIIIDTFKRNGSLKLLPFDIVNHLSSAENAWTLKEIIIWDKEKNLPWNSKGKFKNQFEYILYFTKGKNFQFNIDPLRELLDLKKWWKTYPERYNPSGKAPSNIWSFTTPIRGWGNSLQNHLCPIPFPLAERIINLSSSPGDMILDPFAGSGTTLALAELMGRKAIGIDINLSYQVLFEEEVKFGAKRYWNNRIKEIIQNETVILNFKNTILKLRKLKFASLIVQTLTKVIGEDCFILVLIDDITPTYYIRADKPILIEILQKDIILKSYIKQAKFNFNIVIGGISNNESILYKYSRKRFYNYLKKAMLKELDDYNSDSFYSNIELKITS
jgi:DNA modification methylase